MAIDETNRRRAKQVAYNLERGVDPQPLRKKIADLTDLLAREDADTEGLVSRVGGRRPTSPVPLSSERNRDLGAMPTSELAGLISELSDQMHSAAAELQFELAARLRDEISDLKKSLRQMLEATR